MADTGSNLRGNVRFVVLPLPAEGGHQSDFARTMASHPLVHQELPYDPQFTIYNRRLTAMSMTSATPEEAYWRLRSQAILRHTGELPIEVRGPDAEKLLDLVFTRRVGKTKVGRCSYQIACYPDGGLLLDGVLVRLAEDRFWYGQADGDLTQWLRAHAEGMEVEVFDPEVWISQIQGPDSLKVLEAALDGPYPERFRYFDAAEVRIAGQDVVITRTGFTSELGWEIYFPQGIDIRAIGERILEAGESYGLIPVAIGGARRIEGGLLNAGTDFDETVTPFAAGLGPLVDLEKAQFVGKGALQQADTRRRTWGLRVDGGVAALGMGLRIGGRGAGQVCSSAWSPFLRCGVAIIRLDDPEHGPGTEVEVDCSDGEVRSGAVCELPMYDKEGLIPRGKADERPSPPAAKES